MLTGRTTGRNCPPASRPVMAVASAEAANELNPIARPRNAGKLRVPLIAMPCAMDVGGMTPPPTTAASDALATTVPAALMYFPWTSV